MPDFKAMYVELFQSQTKAISILQKAQQTTEDMYIESEPAGITLFPTLFPSLRTDVMPDDDTDNNPDDEAEKPKK